MTTIDVEFKEIKQPRIGGWLIVVALNIAFTLISMIASNIEGIKSINWVLKNDVITHDINTALFLLFFGLSHLGMMTYLCLITFIFFKKKQSLPKHIIIFYILHVIMVSEYYMLGLKTQVLPFTTYDLFILFAGPALVACFGIPYFLKSKRVKDTFIN